MPFRLQFQLALHCCVVCSGSHALGQVVQAKINLGERLGQFVEHDDAVGYHPFHSEIKPASSRIDAHQRIETIGRALIGQLEALFAIGIDPGVEVIVQVDGSIDLQVIAGGRDVLAQIEAVAVLGGYELGNKIEALVRFDVVNQNEAGSGARSIGS